MHPVEQVTMFMAFFRMRTELLLRIKIFGSTPIKKFGRGDKLKFLTVILHRIPTILK